MNILITNDDSHRSPLLQIAVDYFSRLGTVHLVVPLHEQSWTSKSISRFSSIHVQREVLCGIEAYSVAGTPADCVNLGINNLLPVKPDFVVSGINAGINLGLGFLLSSGTVGACLEANLAGLPALALSQCFDPETRNRYTADYMIELAHVERFREQTDRILLSAFNTLLSPEYSDTFLESPVTWNLNFPFRIKGEEVLAFAPVGRTRYARTFHEQQISSGAGSTLRVFKHGPVEEIKDADPRCDSSRIAEGVGTISVFDVWAMTSDQGRGKLRQITASFER